jgi:hypothetical protein
MKTGRNELCPCGSGKKFKKCCMDKVPTTEVVIARPIECSPDKPIIPGLEDMKPDPFLWALIHVNGRDPKKCTCNDCADRDIGCPRDSNPKHCSETALMSEPEFG